MGTEDKSGSDCLEPHSGTTDWSRHSDSHPVDISGSWRSQHLEIIPELIGGSGTSMQSETHPQVTDRSGSIDHFDIKPTVTEGNRSTNPFETIPEVAGENDSASSSEDLFQVDMGLGNFELHAQPSRDEKINVSNNNSSKSKAVNKSPGLSSTSHFPQVTNESMFHDLPPTQSPPRQVMDRSREYDPLRIPSAIFEQNKSSTPQEWSVASNESLFSIHIGNNSFSRDQFKSEELTKTDEPTIFNPSPTIPEVGADREFAEIEKSDATRGAVKNTKNEPKETTLDKIQEKAPSAKSLQNRYDMFNHSNESSRSFAFPTKKKKKRCCACGCIPFFCCRKRCKRKKCAWPWCYCSNCSCTFCYCSWPSCYCSNCSWAFCYCWNCSLKRLCCHSSTTLTDRVKSITVKTNVAEKQQKKPLDPEETPKSSSTCCWFSCFSCHPCSCSFSCFRCCGCGGCCRDCGGCCR